MCVTASRTLSVITLAVVLASSGAVSEIPLAQAAPAAQVSAASASRLAAVRAARLKASNARAARIRLHRLKAARAKAARVRRHKAIVAHRKAKVVARRKAKVAKKLRAKAMKVRKVRAIVRRFGNKWRAARVSWYGPGFYGHGMAGGGKLRRNSMVLANKHLPFGTKVEVRYKGKAVVVPVRDRGPYVRGREFDLGPGTARHLRFRGVGTIRYRVIGIYSFRAAGK